MTLPNAFTILAELKADWPRVLKRVQIPYRGYLAMVDIKLLGLYSSNYRTPVLAIQHPRYNQLNKNINLLNAITSAVNNQLVHKISGVRFIKPMEDKEREVIESLIEAFDAELVDVEA